MTYKTTNRLYPVMPDDSAQLWKIYNRLTEMLDGEGGRLPIYWAGFWDGGEYRPGDQVRNDDWLAIANKVTSDRPAPQAISEPTWILPDAPTWEPQLYTGTVYSGVDVIAPAGQLFVVSSIRAWIPDISIDAAYRLIIYDKIADALTIGQSFTGADIGVIGWATLPINKVYVRGGNEFSVLLESSNSSATTNFTWPWNYSGISNQDNDPGSGNWDRNNQQNVIRFNKTDADGADRSGDLATIIVGTTVRMTSTVDVNQWWEYEVVTITDAGAFTYYSASLVDTGTSGGPDTVRCDVSFAVPVIQPASYVQITDEYLPYSELQGYISFDSLNGGTSNQNAYGIDIEIQEYAVSLDWDLISSG